MLLAQNATSPAANTATGQDAAPPNQVGHAHEPGFWASPETWVAIAFVIFVVLFGRRLWSALTGMLDRRAAAVRAELAEAARLKQEAEAMLADAKARRDQALADAERLLEGAKAEAERLGAAAAADAEANARRRERMALDRIAAAEKAAVTEVRLAAIEVATQAAQRVIRDSLGEQQDAQLIDQAIASLPAALGRRAA
jgi:F-type H+-transporting ATPase subunit b